MAEASNTELPTVGPSDALALIDAGALLVDVREDFEWQAGHAEMARHVPLGELEERVGELPRDKQLVLVCRAGGRSARATAFLLGSGFQASNLAGGMTAWAAAALPMVSEDGSPAIVA
jgi:rhodanese-related sulfurtransferase